MNSVNSKIASRFTKLALFSGALLISAFPAGVASAWEIDLSRRQTDFTRISNESRLPASTTESAPVGLVDRIIESSGPTQDIVIMNTDKGFVPESVYLRKGGNYKIHVVNVNESEKNVSFVLDAFSEHHNTLFGKTRTFTISPKTDGVFSYQCPETAVQGKLIVTPDKRTPASE